MNEGDEVVITMDEGTGASVVSMNGVKSDDVIISLVVTKKTSLVVKMGVTLV